MIGSFEPLPQGGNIIRLLISAQILLAFTTTDEVSRQGETTNQ
jgi:hypothetical protein